MSTTAENTVVSRLVATLSSKYLPNDGEKPNKPKETFVSEMWLW